MRLLIYFGIMLMTLALSIYLANVLIKKTKNLRTTFVIIILVNFFVLGIGSLWWFFTETDGISQGIGVISYGIALVVFSLVDFTILSVLKGKFDKI